VKLGTVLVTGGSGFLGGHVLPLLVEQATWVHALARSDDAADRVAGLGARPLRADLDDPASVDAAFAASGAETLVNLASMGFGHAPAIVGAAEEAGLRRAVFVSTTSVFTSLPAPSKAVRQAAEASVQDSSLDWTIIRPTMIYGTPADRNMARLLALLRRTPVIPIPGHGRALQQPVHVDDLARTIVNALDRPAALGAAYDVAGPEPLSLRQIIEQAADAIGRRARLVPVPLRPAIAVARLYERAVAHPRLRAEQLQRLEEDKAFDIGAARVELGHDPRPFSEGIAAEAAMLARR
jgi:nucleoside-diphosphate-sugar epimerase